MKKEKAFTLSEVIITLVVLGIVAAITVPMMSNSAGDKKWNVAKQKAKATIGEAFRLMTVNGEISTTNADGTPRTTEYMVTKVLPKYLKLDKTCAKANAGDCGFPTKIITPEGKVTTHGIWGWAATPNYIVKKEGTSASVWGTAELHKDKYPAYNTSYLFRTIDGFSVNLLYNPYCVNTSKERWYYYGSVQLAMDTICFMGIYDMNGKKGPNQVGKDIGFIGSFYNGYEAKATAVLPYGTEKASNASGLTGSTRWHKLKNYCDNLKEKGDWKMPDMYEMSLVGLNYYILANGTTTEPYKTYATTTSFLSGTYKTLDQNPYGFQGNAGYNWSDGASPYVRCVRANALK